MVMSKVSKAIAASFLCLLFNAGGNVTNAMNSCCESPNENFSRSKIPTPMIIEKKEDNLEKVEIKEEIEKKEEIKEKKGKKEGEDGKKIPWNIILPIITGVGGLVGGTLVGKFVF